MTVLFVISVLMGILSFVSYNIGFALEKQAVSEITEYGSTSLNFLELIRNRKWLLGFILTVLSVPFYYVALLWAPLIAIAPLVGIGLIALLFYSHIRMKEYLSVWEIINVVVIAIGMAIGSVYAVKSTLIVSWEEFNNAITSIEGLIILLVGIFILTAGIIIGWIFSNTKTSVLFSVVAGLASGFQAVLMKGLTLLLRNWQQKILIVALFISLLGLTALCSTLALQLAFKRGKITGIMSMYNSIMIFYPIIFGGLALKEWQQLTTFDMTLQIIGIGITIIGVILIAFNLEEVKNRKGKISSP